jgi:chromosome segregation ATPase
VTALLGWFGARFTAHARLEKTLLDASRALVEECQAQHARDGVRISALEETVREREGEIQRLRGEVRQAAQREDSLRRLFERSGVPLPPEAP